MSHLELPPARRLAHVPNVSLCPALTETSSVLVPTTGTIHARWQARRVNSCSYQPMVQVCFVPNDTIENPLVLQVLQPAHVMRRRLLSNSFQELTLPFVLAGEEATAAQYNAIMSEPQVTLQSLVATMPVCSAEDLCTSKCVAAASQTYTVGA